MLTLDDIFDHLQQAHRYENYIMALCEFHEDGSPSMMVSEHGFRCKSCGERGSLAYLYQKVSGRVVIRAYTKNPAAWIWRKWEEKFGSLKNIAKIAHRNLIDNPDDAHYLIQRKIESYIKAGTLGYLDGYYTFPVRDEYDEIVGITARASPTIQTKKNRYTTSHDCPSKLYIPSWRTVLKNVELYLVYGIIDSWTLHASGYAGITGLAGQTINPEWLERFRKTLYIIPDKGEEKSALELQSHLGWRGKTLLINWPENCKDLNDIHCRYSSDTVSELIEKAKERYIHD